MRKIIFLIISLFLTFTLFPQDKTSDVMKTQDKTSDVMKTQDKTSDVMKTQDKTSDVMKTQDKTSDVMKTQDKTSDVMKTQDKTSDVMANTITGSIKKGMGNWIINLSYNDKKIEGDFQREAFVNLPVNTYPLNITIGKIKYKGRISQKIPVFGNNFYDIDVSASKTGLKGSIKISHKNTYRKDLFDMNYSEKDIDKNLDGYIEYTRKDNNKIFSLKLEDQDITGTMKQRSVYLTEYSLRFGDKRIKGTIDNKRPEYIFKFQSADLTEIKFFYSCFLKFICLLMIIRQMDQTLIVLM